MPVSDGAVERFHAEANAILQYLQDKGEVSFMVTAATSFKKALVLSAASYCEFRLTEIIRQFCKSRTENCEHLLAFLEKKAIERQYHTWFDWESENPNKFIGLFGDVFKKKLLETLKSDQMLDQASRNFVRLGKLRNCLVHQNYASFAIDKTSEEIFSLYKEAAIFLEFFEEFLKRD